MKNTLWLVIAAAAFATSLRSIAGAADTPRDGLCSSRVVAGEILAGNLGPILLLETLFIAPDAS